MHMVVRALITLLFRAGTSPEVVLYIEAIDQPTILYIVYMY